MNVFEGLTYVIFKPMLLYVFSPIIFHQFSDRGTGEKAITLLCFIAAVLAVIFFERMAGRKLQIYKPVKEFDKQKFLVVAARYLALEYKEVKVRGGGSIRGAMVSRGFEDEFRISAKDDEVSVAIKGNFPFPASLFNRMKISRDIENEFRGHGLLKA